MKKLLISVLLSIACSLLNFGQDVIIIQRIDKEISFDGIPDEGIWEQQASFEFFMHTPVYGGTPTEKTDFRMCFDDGFLYAAAKNHYTDASIMASAGKKRDYDQPTCDWFGFHLDTYHDKQNALLFYTNPNGIRFDAAVKRDLQNVEQDVNFSWNTYWEVKTTKDDNGWYAEFKIPISSLRFEDNSENVEMGLTIVRFIPSKNESLNWPDISPDYVQATWKPSLAGTVVFQGLKTKKPFYVSPYILAGVGQETELNNMESGYDRITSPKFDAGLDLKIGITSNLTVDLTVNTDFAQVEADDQQINLSRFSLFFPEKRVFFQEKSDVFDYNLGGPSQLFYSRRIGLYDGEPIRILGGVRMTGRTNGWDIGLLDMQTGISSQLPSENFGVVRLKKTVFNENSFIGGMITSRIGVDGRYNFAYGLDGVIKLFGDEYLNLRFAQTAESDLTAEPWSKDPSRVQVSWERRREKGLGYDITYSYSGKDFNPGMGFQMRDDYSAIFLLGHYAWFAKESSFIRKQKFYTRAFVFKSLLTDQLDSQTVKAGWSFEGKNGMLGDIGLNSSLDVLTDTLEFSDEVFISPGSYQYNYVSSEWMLPPTSPLIAIIKTETGSFYDGWKLSSTLMPTYSISTSFDLSGTYRLDWVSIASRNMGFLNHILGVKALLTFTTKTSLAAFVQYNTAIENVSSNIRFRYNPREGVDFYLVYNEGLNTNPYSHSPYLPVNDNRTLMAKFTYTWGR